MLQFENKTPFPCEGVTGMDATGRDVLIVAVKGTFQMLPRVVVAQAQVPVTLVDEYLGEPGASSLVQPSDILLPKPGFDVVFKGNVHAPDHHPVTTLTAALMFRNTQKLLKVTGRRFWKNGRATPPEPFTELPVVYENTFGGVHHFRPEEPMGPGTCVFVPDNPVGTGFRGQRKPSELEGMRLPEIQWPGFESDTPEMNGKPAGLGPVAPFWSPRKHFAGTYDEAWLDREAPALPRDFDPQFFQTGSEGLRFPNERLVGGEPVRLVNLAPEPDVRFEVPLCPLQATVAILSRKEPLALQIETLWIEPDENRFCLVWKGVFPCERKATYIDRVSIDFGVNA